MTVTVCTQPFICWTFASSLLNDELLNFKLKFEEIASFALEHSIFVIIEAMRIVLAPSKRGTSVDARPIFLPRYNGLEEIVHGATFASSVLDIPEGP